MIGFNVFDSRFYNDKISNAIKTLHVINTTNQIWVKMNRQVIKTHHDSVDVKKEIKGVHQQKVCESAQYQLRPAGKSGYCLVFLPHPFATRRALPIHVAITFCEHTIQKYVIKSYFVNSETYKTTYILRNLIETFQLIRVQCSKQLDISRKSTCPNRSRALSLMCSMQVLTLFLTTADFVAPLLIQLLQKYCNKYSYKMRIK